MFLFFASSLRARSASLSSLLMSSLTLMLLNPVPFSFLRFFMKSAFSLSFPNLTKSGRLDSFPSSSVFLPSLMVSKSTFSLISSSVTVRYMFIIVWLSTFFVSSFRLLFGSGSLKITTFLCRWILSLMLVDTVFTRSSCLGPTTPSVPPYRMGNWSCMIFSTSFLISAIFSIFASCLSTPNFSTSSLTFP